ncbi:MAG: DUF4397 domain-containing protein [Gemmatimonadales bacterium]
MKRAGLFALGFVMALGVTACSDDDNGTNPNQDARVRVVHASPDAPNVDVLVEGAVVLSDVPFKAGSTYLSVPAGMRNFQVRVAGTSTTVINVTPTLMAGEDYTVIAKDTVGSIGVLLLNDDNAAPAAGNVRVRLIHGAPSAPTVDIYVTAPGTDLNNETPTLTGVPFEGVSNYLEVPAGNYQVRITPTGTKTVAIDTGTLALGAGQVRTAIAVDNTGGGAPFGAVLLADLN